MNFEDWLKKFREEHPHHCLNDLSLKIGWNAVLENQWQDIETAPKDGTSILVYKKNKTDDYWCICQVSWFEGRLYADSMEDIIDYEDGILTTTHWMPLPKPPVKK